MNTLIYNNIKESRFEFIVCGTKAVIEYAIGPEVIVFYHSSFRVSLESEEPWWDGLWEGDAQRNLSDLWSRLKEEDAGDRDGGRTGDRDNGRNGDRKGDWNDDRNGDKNDDRDGDQREARDGDQGEARNGERKEAGNGERVHDEIPVDMIRYVLEFARSNHLKIVPTCPYIRRYIRQHSTEFFCIGKVFMAGE